MAASPYHLTVSIGSGYLNVLAVLPDVDLWRETEAACPPLKSDPPLCLAFEGVDHGRSGGLLSEFFEAGSGTKIVFHRCVPEFPCLLISRIAGTHLACFVDG